MRLKLNKNQSGFTLLEIIIVIIIIGILASLALPKFFKTVEFSRSAEALGNLGSIRRAMDVCYQPKGTYAGTTPCDFPTLSISDPSTNPNNHWSYAISGQTAIAYLITATRTTLDGGTIADTIQIDQDGKKLGSGNFSQIKD